jgi:hypothetical protein
MSQSQEELDAEHSISLRPQAPKWHRGAAKSPHTHSTDAAASVSQRPPWPGSQVELQPAAGAAEASTQRGGGLPSPPRAAAQPGEAPGGSRGSASWWRNRLPSPAPDPGRQLPQQGASPRSPLCASEGLEAGRPPPAREAQARHGAARFRSGAAAAAGWVPIKEWRSCREVAENMEALPRARLDQRLLSGALQHMCSLGERAPEGGAAACYSRLLALALPLLPSFDAFGLCILVRAAARLGARLSGWELRAWSDAAQRRLPRWAAKASGSAGRCVGGFCFGKAVGACASAPRLCPRFAALAAVCPALPCSKLCPCRPFCAPLKRPAGAPPPLGPPELRPAVPGTPSEALALKQVVAVPPCPCRSFNPQDLANSLHSLGAMGTPLPPSALPAFCAALERLCARMKPQASGEE